MKVDVDVVVAWVGKKVPVKNFAWFFIFIHQIFRMKVQSLLRKRDVARWTVCSQNYNYLWMQFWQRECVSRVCIRAFHPEYSLSSSSRVFVHATVPSRMAMHLFFRVKVRHCKFWEWVGEIHGWPHVGEEVFPKAYRQAGLVPWSRDVHHISSVLDE